MSDSCSAALSLGALFPASIGWQCHQGLGGNVATRAVSARRNQREFVKGRRAAYAALCTVGFVDKQTDARSNTQFQLAELDSPAYLTESYLTNVVGKNADRSPRWPRGFVGSISHSRNWIVAAAARSVDYASIGIDSEPITAPEQAALLKQDIGHAVEWQMLEAIGLSLPTTFTLLFSAKEAFYKCWYPLKQRFLDFPDVIARRVEPEQKSSAEGMNVGTITLGLNKAEAMQLTVRYGIIAQDVFTVATIINWDVE